MHFFFGKTSYFYKKRLFFQENLAYIKKKQYLCSRKGLTTKF